MRWLSRRGRLPGFGLSAGVTLLSLGLLVVLPLGVLGARAAGVTAADAWTILMRPRSRAAFALSLRTAGMAALANAVLGSLLAWVLVRYRFTARRLVDAVVDLPLALPTAVAGLALVSLYAPTGWVGATLAPLGIEIAYTELGVTLALVFVGLPFVVRSVEPVLEQLDPEVEEAAATLGASRAYTFWRVILPALRPAIVSGTLLAFARGLGEFGSVMFVSGNLPDQTKIMPFLIMTKLDQFDYRGAMVLALGMLGISFVAFALVNFLEARQRRWLPK